MAGAGARGMIGLAFGWTPEHPDYEQLKEEFFVNYESCMTERTFAFDGVAQLIDRLVQLKMPWGVVTNKSKRFTEPLTQAMPLFASAAVVISGDTTPHAKPHPAPLLEAAKRIGN
jgi:N-acetyl-D-muramate 6-phosphate phosphatase